MQKLIQFPTLRRCKSCRRLTEKFYFKMVGYDQFFEFIREYPNQIIVYILCAKLEVGDVFKNTGG